jgi:hypothetical protein
MEDEVDVASDSSTMCGVLSPYCMPPEVTVWGEPKSDPSNHEILIRLPPRTDFDQTTTG